MLLLVVLYLTGLKLGDSHLVIPSLCFLVFSLFVLNSYLHKVTFYIYIFLIKKRKKKKRIERGIEYIWPTLTSLMRIHVWAQSVWTKTWLLLLKIIYENYIFFFFVMLKKTIRKQTLAPPLIKSWPYIKTLIKILKRFKFS